MQAKTVYQLIYIQEYHEENICCKTKMGWRAQRNSRSSNNCLPRITRLSPSSNLHQHTQSPAHTQSNTYSINLKGAPKKPLII
jgi:hypothetical protein